MTHWVPKSLSKGGNRAEPEVDDTVLDEKVVLLLQGRNTFNDRVYSYVELTLRNLRKLKEAVLSREDFMPSDFGTVLAAGRDEPPQELRDEMQSKYNLMEVTPPTPAKPVNPVQPQLWDEE